MIPTLGRGTIALTGAALTIGAIVALFPLALMVVSALKTAAEIVANPLDHRAPQWVNFGRVWTDAQLGRSSLLNSSEATGLTIVLICTTCSMAAYSLARETTSGWRWISAYLLATTTLPIQLYLFPLYVFALSFVYTAVFSPFSIFLLRTYFLTIPKEIEEAGIVDGASRGQIFYKTQPAAGLAGHPNGRPDLRPEHLERVPHLLYVPPKSRSANGRGAFLHPRRPIQQRLEKSWPRQSLSWPRP